MIHYSGKGRRSSIVTRTRCIADAFTSSLVLVRAVIYLTIAPLVLSADIVPVCFAVIGFLLRGLWLRSQAFSTYRVKVSRVAGCVALASALSPFSCAIATAQTPAKLQESSSSAPASAIPDGPKPSPTPTTPYVPRPDVSYLYRAGASCGVGASTSPVATTPATGCGVGITLLPLPIFFEAGVMGPQANRSHITGYISLDGSIPLAPVRSKYLPMALVGYSRLFETGHALDYGLALGLPRFGKQNNDGRSLRIELRDYWTFASPNQHNVMLRVGWMGAVSD